MSNAFYHSTWCDMRNPADVNVVLRSRPECPFDAIQTGRFRIQKEQLCATICCIAHQLTGSIFPQTASIRNQMGQAARMAPSGSFITRICRLNSIVSRLATE